MRGHIKKRYKNSYTIVIATGNDPVTGKPKQRWFSCKGTKREAEQRLAELVHELDTGALEKPGKITLGDFLQRWLAEYAQPNLAPRTSEGYESIIHRHVIPRLGFVRLIKLKPEHVQKYYSDLLEQGRCNSKGGLNPLTVRHHHMMLHRALEHAVKWGLVTRNPVDAVDPPRTHRSEIRVMDENEVMTFLEAAKSTPYYTIFYIALFTGMRRSEFLALRWSDIDLLLGQLSVSRSLHQLQDKSLVFREPKTAKGRRTIALSPSTILVLREHKEKQKLMCQMLDRSLNESDLVFAQADGKPTLPDTVSRAWIRLVERTGLKGVRLHDARHTHASLMLKQGIHPKIVQERLGHANVQITLDTYSHVAPGLQEAAAFRFDELLLPKRNVGTPKLD